MARRNKIGRILGLDGKTLAAAQVLLDGNDDLERYLDTSSDALVVHDYTFAGSGASFLIEALISLWSGRAEDAVDLHRITDLDENNRQLFLAALAVYLEA